MNNSIHTRGLLLLVRRWRNSESLTMQDVATQLGYSVHHVRKVLYGRRRPTHRFLRALSERASIGADIVYESVGELAPEVRQIILSKGGYSWLVRQVAKRGLDPYEVARTLPQHHHTGGGM